MLEVPQRRHVNGSATCKLGASQASARELDSAVASNPYLQFAARVEESGTFRLAWTDDDGTTITAEEKITVA